MKYLIRSFLAGFVIVALFCVILLELTATPDTPQEQNWECIAGQCPYFKGSEHDT